MHLLYIHLLSYRCHDSALHLRKTFINPTSYKRSKGADICTVKFELDQKGEHYNFLTDREATGPLIFFHHAGAKHLYRMSVNVILDCCLIELY